MATGGGDSVLDSRYTCSICLEPLKGRHPKILTCFHTFCLPCLTMMMDRETGRSLQTSRDGQVDKDGGSPVIICPTCRSPTSIPPGGVRYLQKNFYLENAEEEAKNKPPTFYCDLCEEGQTAEYTCGQCLSHFCPGCSHSHDKLCKSSAVTKISTASKPAGDRKSTEKAVELIGKVLEKLSEEEKRLGQERRAREHDIHVRYAILLRHAGEARDVSLASLRDVTRALCNVIENDATLAQEKLKKVKQLKGVGGSVSSLAEVLTENVLCHFEDILTTEEEALLTYHPRDECEESFLAAMGEFIGSVVPTRQKADVAQISETTASGQVEPSSQSTASQKQATNDLQPHGNGQFPQDLPAKVDEMAAKLEFLGEKLVQSDKVSSGLQTQNSVLCQDLAAIYDKLCAHIAALGKEVTSLRDQVRDEVTSLQQGHASVRDKNSLLCQENTQLRDDVTTVKADPDKLQTDVRQLIADQSKLQSDHVKLQTDVSTVTADHSKLQSGLDKLQTDVSNITADQSKLQTVVSKMTVGQIKLKTDVSKMTAGQSNLQTDVSNLTAGQNKLHTDVSRITAGQSKLLAEQTQLVAKVEMLKRDVGRSRKENDKFGKELKSAQDTLRLESVARSVLETKLGKVGVQVAFTCRLGETLTTECEMTLNCDVVIFRVGGGYDRLRGVFTAPVSGLYCFMATSGPGGEDGKNVAALYIVLEHEILGALVACQKGHNTTQAAVQVKAGQKVWLKTFGGQRCTFYAASTYFTGMLVQAEL